MRSHAKALVAAVIATLCLGAAPPAFAAGPPEVLVAQATEVNATSARLRTVALPSEAETSYRFEYGTTTAYGKSTPNPDGIFGPTTQTTIIDKGGALVSGDIATATRLVTGLSPDTTYHFRVRVENSEGFELSGDHTIHTFPADVPAGLPENRIYEMVSSPEKGGADIQGNPWQTVSSVAGDAIAYSSSGVFAGTEGNNIITNYIARRGPNGWTSYGTSPEQEPGADFIPGLSNQAQYMTYTPDLAKGIFYARVALFDEPSLGKANALYLRDDLLSGNPPTPAGSASYRLLSDSLAVPLSVNEQGYAISPKYFLALTGESADLEHVTFESRHNLTQESISKSLDEATAKVYGWDDGVEQLVSIEPDGTPTVGISGRGKLCGAATYTRHTTSETGNTRFFTAVPSCDSTQGAVYARVANSVTVQLNVSERTDCAGDPTCGGDNDPDPMPDPEGPNPGALWTATPDGSKAFFATDEALTDDADHIGADEGPNGPNLYRYDVTKPVGERLTYIATALLSVIGVSDDGQYVYFTDKQSDLDPTHTFDPRTEVKLYVWHAGQTRAVGSTKNGALRGPRWVGEGSPLQNASRVSADGHRILFESSAWETPEMSGNDASNASSPNECSDGGGCAIETYLYNYDNDTLKCVSCPPTGAVPASENGGPFRTSFDTGEPSALGEITVLSGQPTQYENRAISEDASRVFFTSFDPLVPQDTNGRADAYVYDIAAEEVRLLSTGQCNCDSTFVDASADGSDVFIDTAQRLVGIDKDGNRDLYDVRVGGGIAAQNPVAPAQCQGDACQSPAGPPIDATPASSSFQGAGNVKETPKGRKHRKRGHKHRNQAHKQRSHRRTGSRAARAGLKTTTRSHG